MRAWQVRRTGAPLDALERCDDVPGPDVPGPDAELVLVDVDACGLNFADSLLCAGTYQERPDLPFTPGLEVAGRVVGGGGFAPGAPILGLAALPHGGLADRALVHRSVCLPRPDAIGAADAAASLIVEQTAWFALHHRARVRRGDVVLVHAGAGGVGSATIQLAVAAGATVIATAGGADKVARCVALGAHHALDHRTLDAGALVDTVRDLAGPAGVAIVVDPVGGDTFAASTRVLGWEGTLVVVGSASGTPGTVRANHVLVKNYTVAGLHWPRYRVEAPHLVRRAHDDLVARHLDGTLRTDVSEVLAFDDAADGIARLAGGGTVGKLVVAVTDAGAQRT